MKRMLVSLGMSATILLSAAFAQPSVKKAIAPTTSATTMVNAKAQQSKRILNSQVAEKFGINESQKQATTPKSFKPILKHVATYASQDPEKAQIKLVVGECWDDGSGYQILIDSDAHLCDTSFNSGLNHAIIRTYYDMADIKIPANASPVAGETSVLDLESDSTEIAPGVYDVLVVNPSDEGEVHIYVAGGNSQLNDFEFEKGYSYVFEMSMAGNGDRCTVRVPTDLAADALELPILSCQVEENVDIKLTVANNGTADAKDFEIWYYIFEDSEDFEPDTIRQTITTTLAAGEKETYTFTTKVNVSGAETLYVIYAGVTPLAKEISIEDNETVGCFIKKSSLSTLPYSFDLAAYDFIPANPDAWMMGELDGFSVAEANFEPGEPLVSRCFELEAGKVYRLSYDYWAGMNLWGFFLYPEDYHIGFGMTSEPIADWETVYEGEEVLVEDWESMDIMLQPTANGTYAIYFSADFQGLMGLRNIMITEVADNDARLNAFNTGLARLTPVEQVNGTFTATAIVQNRGRLAMNATVEVKLGENVVGSANVANIGADSIIRVNVPLTVSGLKVGDKAEFTATVKLPGEAEVTQYDNTLEQEVEVSSYVMAYDYATEDMYESDEYGIGAQGSIGCGIPFTLVAKDTLTAVSLGWMELESDLTVGIRIHKWNSATSMLGDLIYETSVRRGTTGGQRDYEVPAIILEAGEYMISAIQTTSTFYGLICDQTPGVGLYVTTNTPVNYQDNLGTPAIRAVFGPNSKPKAKDVFVQEITKPKATGLFAENQEVAANVSNLGYEAVTAPISLIVNGKVVATKQVALGAYGKGEVTFVTDLSAPSSEYVLTVFSALEGDEDLSNDTVTKTVNTLEPADPYTLNFEYCEDFAIDGFNPAWRTVDVDGSLIYGFQGITFPHDDEPFAFISFNPESVGLTEDGSMVAHSGERLGAAFCAQSGVNNDWLISPKLKIVDGKEYMKFFVKTYNDQYGLEKYNVLISSTDDKIESFQKIGATREAPAEEWQEVTIDLKEYSGRDVYLAIQCVSEDAFIFMIDDITVCGDVANENVAKNIATQLSVYPNPAKEMITIHAQDAVINQVDILNVAGMMVYQSNALNTTDYRYSVSKLNSGIYFARVTTDKGIAVMKFVVR